MQEYGPVSAEVVKRVYRSGNARSPEEALGCWWEDFRRRIDLARGEDYRTQNDIALESFREVLRRFGSREDPAALRDMMNEHWSNPPIHDDAKHFMRKSTVPVYFVTNSDDAYVSKAIKNHGLSPAGVITSEQARYSKPRPEIFRYALEKTGLKPWEVIHIGDSLDGDIKCPAAVGIKGIWLNRDGRRVPEGIEQVKSLIEAGDRLFR